jgi:hypothetical protein
MRIVPPAIKRQGNIRKRRPAHLLRAITYWLPGWGGARHQEAALRLLKKRNPALNSIATLLMVA